MGFSLICVPSNRMLLLKSVVVFFASQCRHCCCRKIPKYWLCKRILELLKPRMESQEPFNTCQPPTCFIYMLQSLVGLEKSKTKNNSALDWPASWWLRPSFPLHRQSLAERWKVAINWLVLLRSLIEVLLPSLLMSSHHKHLLRPPHAALLPVSYQQGGDGNLENMDTKQLPVPGGSLGTSDLKVCGL